MLFKKGRGVWVSVCVAVWVCVGDEEEKRNEKEGKKDNFLHVRKNQGEAPTVAAPTIKS